MTIPYFEKIVSDYLRENAEVVAITDRIVGKTPSSTSTPWVRVTQFNADNRSGTSEVEHLIAFSAQFDCYAGESGGQPEANRLALAVRHALHEMQRSDLSAAVVSRVLFTGMGRQPSSDVDEPAREGFRIEATITMRNK